MAERKKIVVRNVERGNEEETEGRERETRRGEQERQRGRRFGRTLRLWWG